MMSVKSVDEKIIFINIYNLCYELYDELVIFSPHINW